MKNTISKETPKMGGLLSWKLSLLTFVLAFAFIYLLVDTLVNGVGVGDMVLCFGPLFSGLKDKLNKGLDKLNGFMKDDEEGDDVFDKFMEKLEGGMEKGIERKLEREERRVTEDVEVEIEEEERKWREEDEEMERKMKEEEEEMERIMKEAEEGDIEEQWKKRIAAKRARGEELTQKEKFALSLIEENEDIRAELKRKEAEYDAQIAAQKEAKKEKRKEMFSKIGKVIAGVGAKGSSANGSATNNSQSNSTPQKTVRKVWTMRYIGQGRSDGPEYLQVPSANQTGRPTGTEIKEALLALGYDNTAAHSLANGGGESTWEVVS